MFLICIFLLANDVECLFKYMLTTSFSSWEKCLFRFLVHFETGLVFVLLSCVCCKSSLDSSLLNSPSVLALSHVFPCKSWFLTHFKFFCACYINHISLLHVVLYSPFKLTKKKGKSKHLYYVMCCVFYILLTFNLPVSLLITGLGNMLSTQRTLSRPS